jgi:two-component system response regulator YesN
MDIQHKILVVEDEPMDRLAIVKMMEKKFLSEHISNAENGKVALEFVKKNNLDAIFTDIRMPEMDGIEFIKEVRKFNTDVTIVVISAFESRLFNMNLNEYNIKTWILKPITMRCSGFITLDIIWKK